MMSEKTTIKQGKCQSRMYRQWFLIISLTNSILRSPRPHMSQSMNTKTLIIGLKILKCLY